MSIIDVVRAWICQEPVQPVDRPFTILHHVSGSHVRSVLRAAFPDAHIRIADAEYSTVSLDEFNAWIRDDMVSERSYYSGWHDCDNFARNLRCAMFKINRIYQTEIMLCYAEGMSPGGYHAFDIFIDLEDQIFITEPQSDDVVPCDKSRYEPDFIQL